MFLILILFKNIRNWIKQIEQNAQNNVCKVLVGINVIKMKDLFLLMKDKN